MQIAFYSKQRKEAKVGHKYGKLYRLKWHWSKIKHCRCLKHCRYNIAFLAENVEKAKSKLTFLYLLISLYIAFYILLEDFLSGLI